MAESQTPHLVLARKWRPERFSELVGQEHVTRTLGEALKRGRIAHAFLFTGIRGVGKTTAARILARCLNCEKGPTAEPCGECAACVEIRSGSSLDVNEIDGATYRKIEDARAIIENLSYRPARDRFKIYIIDEAHQLTDSAFNALLKTLEEPPPHVKFILATTEPQKMPETILSRLQRYDFRRIPYLKILERLQDLAGREGVEAEESALRLLAREAGGSMRDAERMLETAIATASGKVTEAEVASSLGVASRTTVLKMADAILQKNAAAALAHVRELASRGANLESFGRDLLETLRNLAVAKLPAGDSDSPLDDIPDHEVAELKRLAGGCERARHHAAVPPDGGFAGTDSQIALPRPAARDGGRADGVAGRGGRRRRIAARDRFDASNLERSAHIVWRWLWRPWRATRAGAESAIERFAAAAGRG